MLRVDGTYLYEFGAAMHPVSALAEVDTKRAELYFALLPVKSELEPFLYQSVFSGSLKTVFKPARDFIAKIDEIIAIVPGVDWDEVIPSWKITGLKSSFRDCEAVITAELRIAALYYVSPKGGFDTGCLTERGEDLFPVDLASKVPGAMPDIKAAARCIAFELPTAAGFHLHRANEAVLRVYWDHVTGGKPHPTERNMGVYLGELNKANKGKKEVREHLKSIKDLHRNPLMHPDQSIESIDQALDLMAAIRCSIGYMLREIGTPSPELSEISAPDQVMP